MKLKILLQMSLFLFVSFFVIGPVSIGSSAQLPVVASIFPVADMVKQVGGNYVDVMAIIPPGASPHTFSLKPSQVKRISDSRIYFSIGAGLETWIDKFIPSSQTFTKRVILSDGISLIEGLESHHDKNNTESPEMHHAANPHIWLDPQIAQVMIHKMVYHLSAMDNAHRDYYEKSGDLYRQKLDQLDHHINDIVSQFTVKKYVSFHPAWAYFAKRYGLESVGTIEASPGRHPTPQTTMKIVNQIKTHEIRAVFAEPQLNPRIAEVIAREANARVLLLDPIGGPDLKGRNSYIDLMHYNLEIMKEAMR